MVFELVAFPMMLVAGLGAVISLFVPFRRARGDERPQIKWFACACALTFGFVFVSQALSNTEGGLLEAGLAVVGLILAPSIPVATGVAIFKYRLYDIDRPSTAPSSMDLSPRHWRWSTSGAWSPCSTSCAPLVARSLP